MANEKKTLEEWLKHGMHVSGEAETSNFCDLLDDVRLQMIEEGESEQDILVHLCTMADQFIEVAKAFKQEFGKEEPDGNDLADQA